MKTKLTRRDFLEASGALIVCFGVSQLEPFAVAQGPFGTHPSHVDPEKLDSWLAVSSDGGVTAYTGKCDFGQGIYTAQTQLVSEELCVPLSKVKLIQCDTEVTPDQGTTSGSQSTPTNFNTESLAQAAATAREALVGMAAQKLGVPADQLRVENGIVSAKSGHVSYRELIGGKHFNITVNSAAKRRSHSEWDVLGKPVLSLDRVALMTGTFEFVHNVHTPGMVHGRVVRPPELGATVVNVDEKSVQRVPGFIKVVVKQQQYELSRSQRLHPDGPLAAAQKLALVERRPRASERFVASGWFVASRFDDEVIWKDGGTAGYATFIGYSTKTRRNCILLSNTADYAVNTALGTHLVNAAYPSPKLRREVPVDPVVLAAYAGRYMLSPTFVLTVRPDGGRLFIQATRQAEAEVYAESGPSSSIAWSMRKSASRGRKAAWRRG